MCKDCRLTKCSDNMVIFISLLTPRFPHNVHMYVCFSGRCSVDVEEFLICHSKAPEVDLVFPLLVCSCIERSTVTPGLRSFMERLCWW